MTTAHDPTDDFAQPQGQNSDDIAALEAQIRDLTAQVQKLTDIAARSQADLQNAKVRMQRDREELGHFATENVLRVLLPALDHFKLALSHRPKALENDDWAKGIFAIEQELFRTLNELGLERMEVLGQQADTAKHEVLSVGPGTEGEIIQVFEDGYELAGKVVRPAKVKVGDGTAKSGQ